MRNEDFSFFQNEEFQQHLKDYENMMNGGDKVYFDAEALTDIAEYYVFHNEPEKAEKCIGYALTVHPDAVDPLIFKARQYMIDENGLKKAISLCNLITDQNDREVVFLRGELILREKGEEEAEAFFRNEAEKLNDDPEEKEMFVNDVSYILQDYGLLDQAMKWAQWTTELDPKHEHGQAHQCELLMGLGYHDEAVKRLESFLDENPYSVRLWNLLANNYVIEDRLNDAIEAADFSLAINNDTNPWALMIKIRAFFYLENYEKAHELSEEYFQKYGCFENYSLLYDGLSLVQMEKYEEAIGKLKRINLSVLDHEEQQQVNLQLSTAYCFLRQPEQAVDYLGRVYGDKVQSSEEYLIQKGYIYLECNDEEKALESFKQVTLTPAKEFMIASMLYDHRRYEPALEHLLALEKLDDENIKKSTYAYISFCYKALGNREKFLEYLKRACDEAPGITKNAIGSFFQNMEPDEYYEYACNHE